MGLLYGDFDEIMNNTYYYFWKIYVCLTVACNGALEYVFKHKPLNCNGKLLSYCISTLILSARVCHFM